jgi:hypothetical protein
MKLTLSHAEVAALSDATKHELGTLLGLNIGLDIKSSSFPAANEEQNDEAEEITYQAMKRFMSGVSAKTKKVLGLFAEYNGETTVSEIEKRMGEDFHWPGFMSGVTRRIRKMTGDTSAKFFDWDEGSDDWKNWNVSVSPMTSESLKKFYSSQKGG